MIFLDSTLIQMSLYCSKSYSAANFKLGFTWLGILYLFQGIYTSVDLRRFLDVKPTGRGGCNLQSLKK